MTRPATDGRDTGRHALQRRRALRYIPTLAGLPPRLRMLCLLLGLSADAVDGCQTCREFERLLRRRFRQVVRHLHPDTARAVSAAQGRTYQRLIIAMHTACLHHQGWSAVQQ